MRTDDRRVDHVRFGVLLASKFVENVLPDPTFLPTRKARIHRLPWPETFRQVAPWRARADNPKHRVDHDAMTLRRWPHRPALPRQQTRNSCPLLVAKFVPPLHRTGWSTETPSWKENSRPDMEDTA